MSVYSWQTVCNVFAMITGIIAAGLYGNIGLKVAYTYIVEEWLRGPSLMSPKGRWAWSVAVVIYWAIAFILVRTFLRSDWARLIKSRGPLSRLSAL